MENKDSDVIPLLYFGIRHVIIIVLKTVKTQRGEGFLFYSLWFCILGTQRGMKKGKVDLQEQE